MSMFPWEDWFYDIDDRTQALNDTWNEYQSSKTQLLIKADRLGNHIQFLQELTLYNSSLLLNISIGEMDKEEYTNFLLSDQTKEPKLESSTLDTVLTSINGMSGLGFLARAAWYFGKFAKAKYVVSGMNRAAATAAEASGVAGGEATQLATLQAAATSSESAAAVTNMGVQDTAALAEQGAAAAAQQSANAAADLAAGNMGNAVENIGKATQTAEQVAAEGSMSLRYAFANGAAVVLVIGLDCLMGCLKGAKEKKALEAASAQLQTSVEFLARLDEQLDQDIEEAKGKITEGLTHFVDLIEFMKPFITPKVPYDLPKDLYTDGNYTAWRSTIETLAEQYLLITKVKNDFKTFRENYLADNPGAEFGQAQFDAWLDSRLDARPTGLSEQDMRDIVEYIAERSPDMKSFTS